MHATAANESDAAGYTGVDKRPEVAQAQAEGKIRSDIEWNVAQRRSTIKTLTKALERVKAQIRARVEHPFHVAFGLPLIARLVAVPAE